MDKHLVRVLDTNGDGTGTKEATGTYAVDTDFYIEPLADETNLIYRLERLIVTVKDTTGMDADKYGNGITLTNGIYVLVEDSEGLLYSLTDPDKPILTNGDWSHYCYDADVKTWGTGNEHLVVRWTFRKHGDSVNLRSWRGEKLVVRLKDTFTGLLDHTFTVEGLESTNI